MLNSRQIFKGSVHILTGQLATSIVTVGFTIFFAHKLSKEEFAAMAIFSCLLAVTNMISNFGLETYCLREIPHLLERGNKSQASSMIKLAVVNRSLWSLFISGAVYFGSEYTAMLFFKDVRYSDIIRIMSAGLAFGSLNVSFELLGQALKAFKEIAGIKFANALSYCILSTVFYIAFGYKGWVVGFALSRIVGVGLYFRLFRRWLLNPFNGYEWLRMAKASLPFYLRGYMRFGLVQLDQLVIGIFMSPATLSAYYIARSLTGYVDVFIEATGKPLLVKTAELKILGSNAVAEGLRKMSRYHSFTFVPICFGVAAFGRPILEIFGGAKYLNAYPLLIIFCLTTLVRAVWSEVYVRGVFIVGQPRDTLLVDVVGCLTNTVSLIMLIKLLGALGVAMSVLFSTVSVLIAAFVILNGTVNFSFDKGGVLRSILATAAPLLLAISMQIIHYDLVLMPVYACVSFLLYLLIMIRLFEDQDIMLLESVLTGRSGILPRILHCCGMPQVGKRTS